MLLIDDGLSVCVDGKGLLAEYVDLPAAVDIGAFEMDVTAFEGCGEQQESLELGQIRDHHNIQDIVGGVRLGAEAEAASLIGMIHSRGKIRFLKLQFLFSI